MSSEHETRLRALLQRLVRAQVAQKDSTSETLIREALQRQPDAAYLLIQRVLVLEAALEETREQMARVQSAPIAPPVPVGDGKSRRMSRLKHAAAAGVAAGAFLFQGVDDPANGARLGGGPKSGPEAVIELALDGEASRGLDRTRQTASEALIYFDGYLVAGDDEDAGLA